MIFLKILFIPLRLFKMREPSRTYLQTIVSSILLLAACSPIKPIRSEIWDNSLLVSNPCLAPCFYGIEPGTTTLSEAESLLKSAGLCSQPSYIRSSSPIEPEGILCENLITVKSDSGKEITRYVSIYAPAQLTVEMVFDQLGYPDAVMVDAYGKGEEEGSYMNLYYQNGFTRLILMDQDRGDFRLAKDSLVDWIVFYEEGFFEELIEDTSPWSGFRVYPPDL